MFRLTLLCEGPRDAPRAISSAIAVASGPFGPAPTLTRQVIHSRIVEDRNTAKRIPWLANVPRFVAVGGKASADEDFPDWRRTASTKPGMSGFSGSDPFSGRRAVVGRRMTVQF